jgi:hypothetical protein
MQNKESIMRKNFEAAVLKGAEKGVITKLKHVEKNKKITFYK